MPEQFDWISAVEQRYAAANDVAMKEWPRVATLDSRVVSALKDIPQLLAEIRKIRVATQVSPPTPEQP